MSTIIAIVIIIGVILLMFIQKIRFHLVWKQVYTAFGHKQYYEYLNKLKAKGISYRTRTPFGTQRKGEGIPSYDATQYDIYVRKKEVYKVGE
jgi:hypothetical protein